MGFICKQYQCFVRLANAASPAMLLIIRFWIANIFWASGMVKINDWEGTIYLFTYEHPVPFLMPELAAYMGTAVELICPVLLALGFATRLATIPLIIMTAVINFTYQESPEHYYWAMLLGVLLCYGAGKFSVDYLLCRKGCPSHKK
mgnify:CR=1 FL=1